MKVPHDNVNMKLKIKGQAESEVTLIKQNNIVSGNG